MTAGDRCVLAIDQGTTGTTCLVIDPQGAVRGRAYRELTQHFPKPGWVEHDPHEMLSHTISAANEAIAASGCMPVAIGITNQRETVVVWDRATGRAVHRAIVWQDRRTAERCNALAPHAAMITARTGLVIDPYFSATKLEWLLALPDLAARAERGELAAGTVDSWLVWHLSGGAAHVTDHTNASRTMLYDLDARTWSTELCALFGIPMAMLPAIVPSSGAIAVTDAAHFGVPIRVMGIAGDQQAALFGQGGWHPGDGKNTYGTGAFLLLNTGSTRPAGGAGLLTTVACDAYGAPVYALEASIFIAGAAVQWLRDGLGLFAHAHETAALAASLPSNEGVYFVPALVGLGAPDWEAQARGTIVGITRGTTAAHLARAALEAMAFATYDVLVTMRARGGVPFDRLRVDGGASANDWLMQFQADVLGVPVERPGQVETTALGAAGLAGLAAGVWQSADAFLAARQFTLFEPAAERAFVRRDHAGWRRAVRATLFWARDRRATGESDDASGEK